MGNASEISVSRIAPLALTFAYFALIRVPQVFYIQRVPSLRSGFQKNYFFAASAITCDVGLSALRILRSTTPGRP